MLVYGVIVVSSEQRKERDRAYSRRRREQRSEIEVLEQREKAREWRTANSEKIRADRRKYYVKNRARIISKSLESYHLDPVKGVDRALQWSKANPEAFNQIQKRYKTKPKPRLASSLRSRISKALKCDKGHLVDFLGCTVEDLMTHLESKFSEGMTWDNYGKHGWHVDHIIPLASFNLEDPEQARQASHYTNLQPLWAKDNLKKGAKLLVA